MARKAKTDAEKEAAKAARTARMKEKAEGLERGELASREKKHWKKPCKECYYDEDDDCLIGPYDQVRPKCNGEAHHTRLDSAVRTTNRSSTKSDNRMHSAFSIGKASTICLDPANHKKVHDEIKATIKPFKDNDGLVSMEKYHEVCGDALKKFGGVSDACAKQASKMAAKDDRNLMKNRVRVNNEVPEDGKIIEIILNKPK